MIYLFRRDEFSPMSLMPGPTTGFATSRLSPGAMALLISWGTLDQSCSLMPSWLSLT